MCPPRMAKLGEASTETCAQVLENFAPEYLHSANLLHCRSPFLCASSTSNMGSVSHPAETGLLIPSGKPVEGRAPRPWCRVSRCVATHESEWHGSKEKENNPQSSVGDYPEQGRNDS